jgi:hypothetical protein
MRVQFTRPHEGGSMAGIGNDTKVVDLPDVDDAGKATKVPDGATKVADDTPVSDWTWERKGSFGGAE